jgi:hypothetical protein
LKNGSVVGLCRIREVIGNNLDICPLCSDDLSVASELLFSVLGEFSNGDFKSFNQLFYRPPSTNTLAIELLQGAYGGDLGDFQACEHPSYSVPQYTHAILDVGHSIQIIMLMIFYVDRCFRFLRQGSTRAMILTPLLSSSPGPDL